MVAELGVESVASLAGIGRVSSTIQGDNSTAFIALRYRTEISHRYQRKALNVISHHSIPLCPVCNFIRAHLGTSKPSSCNAQRSLRTLV